MKGVRRAIVQTPVFGRALLFCFRAKTAGAYSRQLLSRLFRWLVRSREITNFTYDLEENNKRYLASLIADIANIEFSTAMTYIREIDEDTKLRQHVADAIEASGMAFMADKEVRFGRRIGWYVFARALKPRVIFETGVDKGLGSCILAAALERNCVEGYEGRYYGTDIDPEAGYLLAGEYARYGSILYGDSIESLRQFDGHIDLFINDSDHSAEYEAEEYRTISSKLSDHAIILGDNSHCTDELLQFSLQTNRHFAYFQENPRDHWYPGAGIGISFKRYQSDEG